MSEPLRDLSLRAKLNLNRRQFAKLCEAGLCAIFFSSSFAKGSEAQAQRKGLVKTKLSPYFTPLGGGDVRCDLCPRSCRVSKGKRGFCRVRENRDGNYYSLVYGNPCAVHVDPIEKKPFFHVLPKTTSFSLATAGCNLQCKFCQNWEISQAFPEDLNNDDVPPELVIAKAKEIGARSVAYTYVEPMIFYEYMFDIGLLAKKAELLNVCHSNGFINPEPLRNLCRVMDAANIDLKGFSEEFYREICSGGLHPVLEALKIYRQSKVHLEITNLVIPTKNDDMDVLKEMCLWIKKELGGETPVHFSRFFPLYKLKGLPPTPVSTLERARSIAQSAGLEYVYIGNVPGHEGENTFCPKCKKMIIKRAGYMVGEVNLKEGKCKFCGTPIPGIWT
jgi:pyruvate formate lyase activating enzyme